MQAGNEEHGDAGGMEARGVTRPGARRRVRRDGGSGEEGETPSREQRLRMHHRQTLWVYWSLVLLGFWMLAAPFTLGHGNEAQWVDPSGGGSATSSTPRSAPPS